MIIIKELKILQKSIFILSVILSITFTNAGNQDVNNTNISSFTETQAIQKAKLTNPGSVTKTESTTHNGINVWEVYMITSTGGELKIKYTAYDGTMVEMQGTSPLFDYEVHPGMNLINYSNARAIALNARNGAIIEWKLEKDESDDRWEYRFFISPEWEIRINANTGVVLRIK